MAALQYAAGTTTSLRHFTSETLNSRKPIWIISSSFTSSFPAKPTRRKNHLRQKILKTLEKPITLEPPTLSPLIPQEKEFDFGSIQEIQESEKPETSEVEIFEKAQILNPARADLDKSVARNSISNYLWWLVGAFVFQTVCAVWVFSSAAADDKNRVSNGTEQGSLREVGGNGEGKSRVEFVQNANGNLQHVDELELETKIGEIRVMAGKVRDMEKLKSNKNGVFKGDEMNKGKHVKNEVEIDDGLIKLRKQLEKAHGKIPVASVENLRKQVESKDWAEKGEGSDEIGSNGELVFKKKYKFKGGIGKPTEKPKGFGRSKDGKAGKSRKHNAVDIGVAYDELSNGMSSSGGERVGDATSALTWESGTKFWWSSLPYVLVIVMRRGQNGEGGEGFYTIENISSRDDQISRMVAFEDRMDANNFCYLLQSFFNDLEDFEADIVPLTVKELNEAAKHYSSRPVVVKRGQLQLYAGQPLGDAEMALRAIVI